MCMEKGRRRSGHSAEGPVLGKPGWTVEKGQAERRKDQETVVS